MSTKVHRIVLYVDDIASQIDVLRAAGVRFRNEIESGPGGKQIQFDDPDGNPIEFHEPPRDGGANVLRAGPEGGKEGG